MGSLDVGQVADELLTGARELGDRLGESGEEEGLVVDGGRGEALQTGLGDVGGDQLLSRPGGR